MKTEYTQTSIKRGYLNQFFKLFHIQDQVDIQFDYHHHDFCKIVIFVSGNVTYWVEGKSYFLKPWDILLINHAQIHKPIIDATKEYERIIIWLDPKLLSQFNTEKCDLLQCFDQATRQQFCLLRLPLKPLTKIKQLLVEIDQISKGTEFGDDIITNTLLIQLLVTLNQTFLKQGKINGKDIQYDESISGVIDYIHQHLTEDITIAQIAEQFFVSKYHLMRKFKLHTGYSIHHYLTQKRLILAKSLIAEGRAMTVVCARSGFSDYSNFVRAFKKEFKMSPKKYYQQYFTLQAFEQQLNVVE